MKIFLSYASEDRDQAEQIYLALTGAGHEVFFDRASLPAGEDYHLRISQAVEESSVMIFLISPDSVSKSSFARSELKFAQEKWKHPKNAVLPVMIRTTTYSDIPNYLKAVTVLEPVGNAAAEVTQWVEKRSSRWSTWSLKKVLVLLAIVTVVALVVLGKTSKIDQEGIISGISLPAYVVLESASETKLEAQARLVKLAHSGINNSGFFWIPDFEFLSGKALYQVYIGPFNNKKKAIQSLCDYQTKFSVSTYGIRLSKKPGREEIRCPN